MVDINDEEWEAAPIPDWTARRDAEEQRLKDAIGSDPSCVDGFVDLADWYAGQHRWGEALGMWRQACRLEPQNGIHYAWIGCALLELGRQEEAVAAFRAGLRADPDNELLYCHLAEVCRATGRTAGAVNAFHELIRRAPADATLNDANIDEPDWAIAYCYLGLLLQKTGLLDGVVAQLHEAIHCHPEIAA